MNFLSAGYMEIKFRDVVAFRTEDAKFPAANLLRGGKWISERKSRSSVNDITLHLGEAHVISHIDLGNWGSSFINIEVSRVGLQRYQTLLPSTELMSVRDACTKKNWTSVHMFSKEHFDEDVVKQKWNLVRVTCLQPFLQNEQFGLSFFKIFSIPEDELPALPAPRSPPPGSAFAKMRDCTLAKVSPLVVNRSKQLVLAAIGKQGTPTKCSSETKRKEAIVSSSSHGSESPPVRSFIPKQNNNSRTNVFHSSRQESVCSPKNCASSLQTCTQTSQTLSSTSAGPNKSTDYHRGSSSTNIQCTPPGDATGNSAVTSRSTKRRLALLTPSGSEDGSSPVQKAACIRRLQSNSKQLKLLQTQVHSPHSGCKEDQKVSDVTVLSDSDSDIPTVILPSATLSPSRELKDFGSDTETIILPLNANQHETERSEEVVTLEVPSSPEPSSSDIQSLDSDAVPGPSRISCPLCSDFFDVFSIEQHAATCGLTPETEELVCPVCSRYFPPDILPRHADLCAERTRT